MVSQRTSWPARTAVKERNRDALLQAARELAAERGFAGTSVDAVAERAGLTKGAVYSIFGSKVGLFLALMTPEWGVMSLRDVCEPGTPVTDAVTAYARHWARLVATPQAQAAFLLSLELHLEAMRQPEVMPQLIAVEHEAMARLAADLEEFARADRRELASAPSVLAEALVGALQGLTARAVSGFVVLDADLFAATAVALLGMQP